MYMSFGDIKEMFLQTLFPEHTVCLICGAETEEMRRFGICGECLKKLPYIDNAVRVCEKCGKPIYNEERFCLECQNHKKIVSRINAPLIYKGLAAELVEELKFYKKRYIAEILGEFVATEYIRRGYYADIAVPVPLFNGERNNAFNHSGLIAAVLSKNVGVPVIDYALTKTRKTKHQASLTATERRKNLEDAFCVVNKDAVKGKVVLLVDDVVTTGSTLNECAKALFRAKAKDVSALTACATEYRRPQKQAFRSEDK
jgi:ComF family protein